MDKDFLNILIVGHHASRARHLKVSKKTLKIGLCLLSFGFLATILFVCDYVQVKKRAFELGRLHQENQAQRSQIHFFSARLEDLEKQLSRLKDLDKKIRIIANLEPGHGTSGFMGMGGPSPSDIRESLKKEKDEGNLAEQMRSDVDRLQTEARSQEESLGDLERLLHSKKEMLNHTPSIWPVSGWVTSGFGFRTNPFTGLNQMHEGLDISNRIETPIVAPANGIVSDTGNDAVHGTFLILSHGFGIVSRYSHLNKTLVKVGQKVKRGERIAEIGLTGKTTGPHLHYEVRANGVPVNPMRHILN